MSDVDVAEDNESSEENALVEQLLVIFPDTDREVIRSVLESCSNNVEQAVEVLLGGGPTNSASSTTNMEADDDANDNEDGDDASNARSSSVPTSPVLAPRTTQLQPQQQPTYQSYYGGYGAYGSAYNSSSREEEQAEALSLDIPGGRVLKHKDLPHSHPFFPLLQCFAGLAPLANYSLIPPKKWHLNKKMGVCRGDFAASFLWISRMLWQLDYMPLTFHNHVINLRELFNSNAGGLASTSAYDQPDYREVSNWISVCLEDDLNLLHHAGSQAVDLPEGCSDEVAAAKKLESLQQISKGIIPDIFRGLRKVTNLCPDCEFVATSFEGMSSLALNTDPHQKRVIEITYVPAIPTLEDSPRKYRLHVTKSGVGADLKRALIERAGLLLQPKDLVITDVYNGRVFQELNDNATLSNIRDRDIIVIYEIPTSSVSFNTSSNTQLDHCFLVHRVKKSGASSYSYYSAGPRLAGSPICIPRSFSRKQMYHFLWNRFKGLFGFDENMSYPAYLAEVERKEEAKKHEDEEKQVKEEIEKDVVMPDLIEGETEEEAAARRKRIQEEKDAEFARKLQAELQEQDSKPYSYGRWKDKEEEEEKRPELFTLRFVSNYGSSCSVCDKGWSCNGCILQYSDDPITIPDTGNISVDWNIPEEELPVLETNVLFSHTTDKVELEDISGLPNIFDSLNVTLDSTVLPSSDPWYCPKCKELRQAEQKAELWELPEILVIHFQRMEQSRWFRSVSANFIDFPIEGLDLSPYVTNPNHAPCIYDLKASMNLTTGPGRTYVSYVQNKEDKKWYSFDSTGCFELDEGSVRSRIVTPEACVLFYQRKRRAMSLKEICLLKIAGMQKSVDLSLLPLELREAIDAISPTDVRYFL